MSVHRLVVRSPQGDLAQGTAWTVAPNLLCSAFHVVGHCAERRWLHELADGVSYWLDGGGEAHALTPAAFDADADLALLACADATGEVLPLAEASRKNVRFASRGYPGFHEAREFTLSGTVVDLRLGEGARAVQLGLDQGADADWAGISGAAVVDPLRVIGAITNVTQGTSTAWGAPVEAIRRLVELAALAERAAQAANGEADRGKLAPGGVDRRRLDDILQRLARERPADAAVATMREELARNRPAAEAVGLDPERAARLRDDYDVIAVREGGRVIRPVAAREFAEILAGSARFGGRHEELAKLDRHALETRSGYFFVTGISGFGKTSLLARWIDLLRRRGDRVCFHFFSPRVPDSLEPKYAYLRLCEQLLAAHALGGDPPRDDEVRLRALYVDLLTLPSPGGRPLIVVLDGLDEAGEKLRPSPATFPRPLGDGVHVVFSARRIAGRNWLADLGLELGDDALIELGRLSEADIGEILERSGQNRDLGERLAQKTLGDPFYVADVVRALGNASDPIQMLDQLPATHSDYLSAWWKEAIRRVAEPGFVDLMGTLAALRAPLGARELTSISAEDQLDNARIGVLLEEAARYLDDDRQGRFWLRHDRIRQFVRETLGADMRKYDDRVTAFALRWNDPTATGEARAYGRRHVVAHLLAQDRYRDALEALQPEFIAARWREDGSYSAMLDDLDALLAWSAGHRTDRDAMCHALPLVVMRESARDQMRGLPESLCRAWVRLDGSAPPLQMLASLPSHRGEAREQLLAVAGEMLDLAAEGAAGSASRAAALELLSRTVGLLPMVRTSAWTEEALSEVCHLVTTHKLEGSQAAALLRQGIAYASQLDEERADLKAVCLAHLAAAALRLDRTLASQLLADIDALADALPVADRAVALAAAFPARRELAPDRIVALAQAEADALIRNPSQSAFALAPLELLLSAWAPDPKAAEVASAKREGRELPLALLCSLGLTEVAWQKVEKALGSEEPAVALLLEAYDAMPAQRPRLLDALAQASDRSPPSSALALARAVTGRWDDMRAVLQQLDSKELATALPACLERVLGQRPAAEADPDVEHIIGLLERVGSDDAAEPAGELAHALSKAAHGHARRALGVAFRLALSPLPEGDADDTRLLVAVALAGEGKIDQAIEVALACHWWHRRIAGLAAVLRELPQDSADRPRIAERMGDLLRGDAESTFVTDAVRTACDTVPALVPAHETAALQLLNAAEVANRAARDWRGAFDTALALYRAHARLDSAQAVDRGTHLLATLREYAYQGDDDQVYEALFSLCASMIENGAADEGLIEHELELARGRGFPESKRVAILTAAAAASSDPARIATWLREAMEGLDALREAKADGIAYFRRLISDLTGGLASEPGWVDAMPRLLNAMVAKAGRLDPQLLTDLLTHAWQRTLELASDARTLQTVAGKYLRSLSSLPPEAEAVAEAVLGRILDELDGRRADLDVDDLLAEATLELGAHRHVDRARAAAQRIADPEGQAAALQNAELYASYFAVADRTPVERTLFETSEDKQLATLVILGLRNGSGEALLADLLEVFKDARVRRLLFERYAPLLAAIVMHRWGPEAGREVVDAVAEFDRRLVAAASQVVRAGDG